MTTAEQYYQEGIQALQKGDFAVAEQAFHQATQHAPDRFEYWNLLGMTFQFQKNWEKCRQAWREALRCDPESTDTKLNLGIASLASNRPTDAEQLWLSILKTDSEHVPSLINLGLFYREREQNQQAHDMWEAAFTLMPKNANVQEWLADVKGVLGMQRIVNQEFEKAEVLLKRAIELDGGYAVLWGYLSELHFQRHEYKEAFATCSHGLNLEPENPTLHHTMGNILRMTHQEDQALVAYQKALECGSHHPATYRAIAELSQSEVDENEQVIQQLFDQYADHFDRDLLETLEYSTPSKAGQLFRTNVSSMTDSVLDLGCGTGLSILPFQEGCTPNALRVGVDLSPKMLEVAKEKSLYTELFCQSIKDFAHDDHRNFQLVLCLDTLVYLRQLEELFALIFQRTAHEGYFVFSTETTAAKTPILQRSGRYAHPNQYVEDILQRHRWRLIDQQESLLRKDGNHWIQGTLWIAQKT